MGIKIVISDPKNGRSVQREVKDDNAKSMLGLKVGDTFKGELIDLTGYEFKITGGSDNCGFPMRHDVPIARKKILAVKGVGVSNRKKALGKDMKYMRTMKGMRQRVTVAGNMVNDKTSQINAVITKHGKENFFPEPKPKAEKEAAPASAPKEAAEKAEPKKAK